MARKAIWAHSAEEDLDVAAEYIHRNSPAYAAAFVHRILKTEHTKTPEITRVTAAIV